MLETITRKLKIEEQKQEEIKLSEETAKEYEIVTEGKAKLFVYRLESYRVKGSYVPALTPVFYNPIMKSNRDIMIAFLRTISQGITRELRYGETMTGVGVRCIRAILETSAKFLCEINDISKEAIKLAEKNLSINGIKNGVKTFCVDARVFSSTHSAPEDRFDYLDLDPFGSPAEFIESALTSVRHGGYVGITATDTATLFGNNSIKMFLKYGIIASRIQFNKEFGVRALIASIVLAATKQEIGIRPELAYSEKHYVRVYARVLRGKKYAKESMSNLGFVLYNTRENSWKTVKMEDVIKNDWKKDENHKIIGPIWISRYIDNEFVRKMYDNSFELSQESVKMILKIMNENSEIVGYYDADLTSKLLNVSSRKIQELIDKIKERGYVATRTLYNPKGIKTDMPYSEFTKVYSELS